MKLTYTERNGVMYPDLALPEQTNYPIGKYGKMRLDYLSKSKKNKNIFIANTPNGKSTSHREVLSSSSSSFT